MSNTTKKVIVNGLSISRILGAFCLPLVFVKGDLLVLIVLLCILFLTDFFDGRLARKWHVQTIGGSLLDPLGDKLLPIVVIVFLAKYHPNMWWLLLIEVGICVLNIARALRGESVHASLLGRFKMWVLSITLVLGASNLFFPTILKSLFSIFSLDLDWLIISNEVVDWAIGISLVVEILTFSLYMRESIDADIPKQNEKLKFKSVKEIVVRLFDEKAFEDDRNKSIVDIIRK